MEQTCEGFSQDRAHSLWEGCCSEPSRKNWSSSSFTCPLGRDSAVGLWLGVPSEDSSASGLLSLFVEPPATGPARRAPEHARSCRTRGSPPGGSLLRAPLTFAEAWPGWSHSRGPPAILLSCRSLPCISNVISLSASWGTRMTGLLTPTLPSSSCPIFQIEETERPSLSDLLEATQRTDLPPPHPHPGPCSACCRVILPKIALAFCDTAVQGLAMIPQGPQMTHPCAWQKSPGGQGTSIDPCNPAEGKVGLALRPGGSNITREDT